MTYNWDSDAPVDLTFDANGIHTQIQQDKVSLRERFESPNASFNEHGDSDAAAVGVHISSKVGWARASTLANRLSTGLKVGSLHWVTDESFMYVVDEDLSFEVISIGDHVALEGLTDDDHTQYILKDGSRVMSGDITLDEGTIQPEAYPTANAVALDPAHVDESWYDAHGADYVIDRHIDDEAVPGDALHRTAFSAYGAGRVTLTTYLGMVVTSRFNNRSVFSWTTAGVFGVAGTGTGSWFSKRMVS